MSLRTRLRLLLLLVIFFIIAAPIAILWSQGYRFDFKNKELVRVGGLYFKVIPRNSELFIEGLGKRQLSSSLLSEGTLINNLLPGVYEVKIWREGYFSWTKSLVVKPLQVTKTTSVILFPVVPTINQIATSTISNFWLQRDRNEAIYFTDISGRQLFFVENWQQSKEPRLIFDSTKIGKIIEVLPSPNNSKILLKLENDILLLSSSGKEIRYLRKYLSELGIPIRFSDTIEWNPQSEDKLLAITSQNRIYEIDLTLLTYRRLLPEEDIVGKDQTSTLFLTSSGNIYRLASGGIEKFDNISLPTKITQAKLFALTPKINLGEAKFQRQYLLLTQEGDLWQVGSENERHLIAKRVVGVWPNPDGSRLALITKDQVLSVYFLSEVNSDLEYEARTMLKLGLVEQNPEDIFWMNDNWHIILRNSKGIEIVEIDSRFPINRISYPIASSRAFWNYNQNTLLYLSQNNLWSWRFPTQ